MSIPFGFTLSIWASSNTCPFRVWIFMVSAASGRVSDNSKSGMFFLIRSLLSDGSCLYKVAP